jgi:hypothetical protein
MNSKVIWIVPLFAFSSSVAMADISLKFVNSNLDRDFSATGDNITLDLTIDGTGIVSLDATPVGSATDANYVDAVNSWDSANVGTVGNAALFGQTFQITISVTNRHRTTGDIGTERISLDGRYGDGIMGVGGANSSRVDFIPEQSDSRQEFLHFEQTGGTAQIQLLDFGYHGASTSPGIWDTQLIAGNVDNTFYNLAGSEGTVDVSALGYVIGSGDNRLTFSMPLDGSHGIGVDGLTIRAVPEPSSFSLFALCCSALMFLRRRFMRS